MSRLTLILPLAGLLCSLAAGPAAAENFDVHMKGLAFKPANINAHVGDTISWINDDILVHTTTARSGEWDIQLQKGATQQTTLGKAGTFPYYCKLHPNMTGTVTVSGK